MRKLFLLILCVCLVGLAGGARAEQDREITDLLGRRVKVPAQPQRLVCLGPGTLRLIVYLGALDRVVGVEGMERRSGGRPYYMAHQEAIDALPVVTPGGPSAINKKPDLEGLLKVGPQLIFATQMEKGLADQIQAQLGVPVVMLSYGQFATYDQVVYDSLRLAGDVLGLAPRAEAVIRFMEDGRRDLLERVRDVPEDQRPKVFVGGIGFRGTHGLESTDAGYIPFTWLGAHNVVAGEGHQFMDLEKLLSLQPDHIFMDAGGMELVAADHAKKTALYQALTAWQRRQVHVLYPFNWYTTNLGTTLLDAYAIGKIIYPQRFADVDLVAKADEIFTAMVGGPVYQKMATQYGPLGAVPAFME